jgi:hypothetical protein
MRSLQDPKVAAPDFDLSWIAVDPSLIASQLAASADELAGLLVEIDEAEKRADITRAVKNTAIEAYDDKFLRVARMAENIFRFAGRHELAKRVRPSTRRPGRRRADEGGPSALDLIPSARLQGQDMRTVKTLKPRPEGERGTADVLRAESPQMSASLRRRPSRTPEDRGLGRPAPLSGERRRDSRVAEARRPGHAALGTPPDGVAAVARGIRNRLARKRRSSQYWSYARALDPEH